MKTPVQHFHAGLKTHFGISEAGKFMDPVFIQLQREARLDVIAFDDWLHARHGEYETTDGLSMREAIAKHYGEPAAQFVESMI